MALASDVGSADDTFSVVTHLTADSAGTHPLEAGDMLLGYDLRYAIRGMSHVMSVNISWLVVGGHAPACSRALLPRDLAVDWTVELFFSHTAAQHLLFVVVVVDCALEYICT